MKRGKKRLLWFAAMSIALLCLVRLKRAPTEAEMLTSFQEHRAAFQHLAAMAKSDHLQYLSSRFEDTQTDGKILSQARFNGYWTLMHKTRASHIIFYHSRPSVYTFPVFGGGATDTSWAVGYAWSDKPLTPLVDSAYRARPPLSIVYSKIEGNWFLYRR